MLGRCTVGVATVVIVGFATCSWPVQASDAKTIGKARRLIKALDRDGDQAAAAATALGEMAKRTDTDVIRALSIAAGTGDFDKMQSAGAALRKILMPAK